MKQFADYISSTEIRNGETPCDKALLEALLDKYEWFTTARVMLSAYGREDPRAELHNAVYGVPYTSRLPLGIEEERREEPPHDTTEEIIDRFLTLGDYRIVPTEDTAEDYATEGEEGPGDDLDDEDMVTEELAEIYLNQGLMEQAKEIYVRLSLLYPKKSVYFAEIIERINKRQTNINN